MNALVAQANPAPTLGQIAYEAYFRKSGGKSLISGQPLPTWEGQADGIRESWEAAGESVATVAPAAALAPGSELAGKASPWLERAQSLEVSDPVTCEVAGSELQAIIALRAEAAEKLNPLVTATKDAYDKARGIRDEVDKPLKEAEAIYRRTIASYLADAQARAERERIDRDAAQQAEAAAERARLAEAQAQAAVSVAQAQQEENLSAAIQAEAEGASPEEIAGMLERPAAPVPQRSLFVSVAPTPPPPTTVQVPTGFRAPTFQYSAEVVDIVELIKHVSGMPALSNLLSPNQTALNGLAKIMKDGFDVPGCRLVKTPTLARKGK